MRAKLSQMDSAAKNTIQMLLGLDSNRGQDELNGHGQEEDASKFSQKVKDFLTQLTQGSLRGKRILFLFFGDHGQNNLGGHGGPCITETSAGFFALSTLPFKEPMKQIKSWSQSESDFSGSSKPINFEQRVEELEVLNQVDFVPVISASLGVPIPENNLGVFHPGFFLSSLDGQGGGEEEQMTRLEEVLRHGIKFLNPLCQKMADTIEKKSNGHLPGSRKATKKSRRFTRSSRIMGRKRWTLAK
ncbi:Alkaline-phosphatase-like protein [Cryptosporidium felis]|nr:Alkaline-phosphatase-like protein [Cryptosporidium felis]